MRNALRKDVFREIRYNPRRFIAIFLIVALGVAFYSGVRAASPDMQMTVDRYYDEHNAWDVQVISTLGFDEEDVAALENVDGVRRVQPGYTVDGFVQRGDNPLLVTFQSLDWEALRDAPDTVINRPELVEGRYPQAADECLVDAELTADFPIGSTLTIETKDDEEIADTLSRLTYTVVGTVRSVEYISLQRGSSSKGSGKLGGFVLIPPESFTTEVYTRAYLQADVGGSRFTDQYTTSIDALCDRLEAAGLARAPVRYDALRADAEKELADAKQKLADGEKELADAKQKLTDGETELADGERQLAEGRQTLADNRASFESEIAAAQKQLDDARSSLDQAEETLRQNEQELAAGERQLEEGRRTLEESLRQLDEGETALAQLAAGIQSMEQQLAALPPDSSAAQQLAAQIAEMKRTHTEKSAALAEGRRQAAAGAAQLDENEQQLKDGKAVLAAGRAEYEKGLAEYESGVSALAEQKASGARALDEAQATLDESERALEEARRELADGWREYEEKEPGALADLEEGRRQIADGEEALSNLKGPEWFLLDLRKNLGFAGYEQDADRIAAIGLVFPLIFFLVAALVSLTNMTRMVEDDRTGIGVLKALGYGRMAIASKYLVYAGTAAVGGIVLGVTVGGNLFPRVIFDAYGILYTLPPILTPVNWPSALQAGAGALACAVLPAFLVCQTELMSTPASLMRPRAPKEGKRILLERVGFLWKRLNFSQKVTCRNIFRYKKRLLMTIFGVAGCTALIFTGFGLKDSIRMMIPLQYEQIQKYDMLLSLKDDPSSGEQEALDSVLEDRTVIEDSMALYQESMDASSDGALQEVTLMVPKDREEFSRFITLRERGGGKPVTLSEEGVVITEKLGRMLGVGVGDTIRLKDPDNRMINVRIDGVTENYVYHYVYMMPSLYESLYGAAPSNNAMIARLTDDGREQEDALSGRLLDTGAVSSASFNTAVRANFDDMISALDIVVVVLILSAAALAFVVLFSLASINIDERKRELATLKVLGFYDAETAMYLHRESLVLTILGILVGLVLGIFLLFFVITTAEVDMVMFTRDTYWTNYVLSSGITLLFALVVNLLTNWVVKRIDMVESLKSIE